MKFKGCESDLEVNCFQNYKSCYINETTTLH